MKFKSRPYRTLWLQHKIEVWKSIPAPPFINTFYIHEKRVELQFCYIIFAKFVPLNLISFLPSFVPQEHEQLSYSSTRSKAPSVIVTGLKPATKYIFHIRVRTAAGYSGYSQKFEFETGDESKFYWRKKKSNTIEVASNSKTVRHWEFEWLNPFHLLITRWPLLYDKKQVSLSLRLLDL